VTGRSRSEIPTRTPAPGRLETLVRQPRVASMRRSCASPPAPVLPNIQRAAHVRLGLRPRRAVSRRAHRRADAGSARPRAAALVAGRLSGRDRTDAAYALRLSDVCVNSRWRRRRGPDPQFRRRPRSHPLTGEKAHRLAAISRRACLSGKSATVLALRPRISFSRMAGNGALAGTKASRTSPPSWNGTRPRSTGVEKSTTERRRWRHPSNSNR